MSGLERYTIQEIAELMEERSGATATPVHEDAHYLDIESKVGKEVFGPLNDEGIHVIAVLPKENGVTRVWLEESREG